MNGEFTAIVPKKALDRLSTKCVLEFFKKKPLASAEASAMERGIYTVTEADLVLINSQGSDAFWQSIIPDKTIRERTLNMWKLAGMDSDARKFAKGKQILIATERALSDALHKHSAEMRDVYPLCRQAGVSSQDADKFMAMLYLCHDFYPRLETVNITPRFLAGLKEGGIQKVNEVLSPKEVEIKIPEPPKTPEIPENITSPAQKGELAVRTEDFNLSGEENENLAKGYYEYRESDLQYMRANGNGIAPIIARIKYNSGAFDIYGFREKAGLPKDSPKLESGHEDKRLFLGVKAGYDAAKERCKEEIELLKFLLPANSGNIEKDLIFLALHRGYKQQKAARALSKETIALMKEAAAQKKGKAYEEKVWRELCTAKELREWPLRSYGDSLNTLVVNMARVAGYVKILKEEMATYPQITETNFGQKIKNMLDKGGDWLEDITKDIVALITEWRNVKKEEDKKIEQRAVQPAGNGFTPTPFSLKEYTKSRANNGTNNNPNDMQRKRLNETYLSVSEIERFLKMSLTINSGFRSPEVNSKIANGTTTNPSLNSSHMLGYAADLNIPSALHLKVMVYIRDNMKEDKYDNAGNIISQAISYPYKNEIHIDVKPVEQRSSKNYSYKEVFFINGKEKSVEYDFKAKGF